MADPFLLYLPMQPHPYQRDQAMPIGQPGSGKQVNCLCLSCLLCVDCFG